MVIRTIAVFMVIRTISLIIIIVIRTIIITLRLQCNPCIEPHSARVAYPKVLSYHCLQIFQL